LLAWVNTKEDELGIREREPMGVHIAFSGAQLDAMGVPEDMDENTLAELVDTAFLTDSTSLEQEIQQWIEDHEDRDDDAS